MKSNRLWNIFRRLMNFLPDNFDPLVFLNIKTEQNILTEDLIKLKDKLNVQIVEYVLINLTNSLKEEEVKNLIKAESKEEKLEILNRYIPNLDERVQEELNRFKKEYQDE